MLHNKLYFYPHSQYDEGINTFADPLLVEPRRPIDRGHDIVEATLNFNLGLVMAKREMDDTEEVSNANQKSATTESTVIQFLKTVNSMPLEYNAEQSLVVYIAALHNVGRLCLQTSNYLQAVEVYSQAHGILINKMQLLKEVLASKTCSMKHYEMIRETLVFTAATLNCIAVSRFLHSNEQTFPSSKTLALLTTALSIHERVDSDHPSLRRATATMMNNIGRIKFQSNDFSGALAVYMDTLDLRCNILGPVHLDVAVTLFNIAEAYSHLGNKAESVKNYEKYLAIASCQLGEDHADVANVLMTIGEIYRDTGNVERASYFMNRAVESSISAFGRNHECQSYLYHELGNLALIADDKESAMRFFEAGLDVERKLEGPDKVNRLTASLALLGDASHLIGKRSNALAYYKEALNLICIAKGSCEEGANILTNIALINEENQEYVMAERGLKEAVRILTASSRKCTLRVAFNLNTLGMVQSKQNKHKMALESFLELLKIRTNVLDATNLQISNACCNVANAYVELGNFKKALHFYRKSLYLERKIELEQHQNLRCISSASGPEGCNHQSTVPTKYVLSTMTQIASVYLRIEKFEEALQYYLDAMKLCFSYDDHAFVQQDVGAIQQGIDACYKSIILKHVNESYKTNGIYNCSPAA
jgi:tetratricopeptide (TPR) repeat protein